MLRIIMQVKNCKYPRTGRQKPGYNVTLKNIKYTLHRKTLVYWLLWFLLANIATTNRRLQVLVSFKFLRWSHDHQSRVHETDHFFSLPIHKTLTTYFESHAWNFYTMCTVRLAFNIRGMQNLSHDGAPTTSAINTDVLNALMTQHCTVIR